jgi:hypothetical protein
MTSSITLHYPNYPPEQHRSCWLDRFTIFFVVRFSFIVADFNLLTCNDGVKCGVDFCSVGKMQGLPRSFSPHFTGCNFSAPAFNPYPLPISCILPLTVTLTMWGLKPSSLSLSQSVALEVCTLVKVINVMKRSILVVILAFSSYTDKLSPVFETEVNKVKI